MVDWRVFAKETNSLKATGKRHVNCRITNTHIHRKQGFDPEVFAIGVGGCNDKFWLFIDRQGTGVFRLHTTSSSYLCNEVIRKGKIFAPNNSQSRNKQEEGTK